MYLNSQNELDLSLRESSNAGSRVMLWKTGIFFKAKALADCLLVRQILCVIQSCMAYKT